MSLAVPVKDGVVLLERNAGEFNVTLGAAVSTVNVTGELAPAGFPGSELVCVAVAVYCPSFRAGLALPELQPPRVPGAVAVETTVPVAEAPA
jgi:hypothetical protein